MTVLAGRRIVLGVTGGVAAYKSAMLARLLVEAGAEVRAVMTASAKEFLGPQTLAAITGHHPVDDLFSAQSVSPHTDLARWADAIVVAPATASFLGRIASGISDDALTVTVLATTSPVLVAPAMHTEMWEHPATRSNVDALRRFGYRVVGPEEGPLAGGDVGIGRLSEPETILAEVEELFAAGELAGWRVLVTAGGTREPIDPVRYLGNRSSGKMGRAIAEVAAQRGAATVLVTTAQEGHIPGVELVVVETAEDMAATVWERAPVQDVVVMAAAVADFRPKEVAEEKLRRAEGPPHVVLEPTPDILAGVAQMENRPYLIGFAAEAGPAQGAAPKATTKGVDLLVANDVTSAGSGFGSELNEVTVFFPDGRAEAWELMPKVDVARRLWEVVAAQATGPRR